MCLANKITLAFITTLALEAAISGRTNTHTHTHSRTGTNSERSSPSISLMKWLPEMDDMTSPPPPITISPLKNLPLKAPPLLWYRTPPTPLLTAPNGRRAFQDPFGPLTTLLLVWLFISLMQLAGAEASWMGRASKSRRVEGSGVIKRTLAQQWQWHQADGTESTYILSRKKRRGGEAVHWWHLQERTMHINTKVHYCFFLHADRKSSFSASEKWGCFLLIR